jgi:AcrR family transcriptional regulator
MGRTQGRTSHDTKELLLEAATRTIRRHGLAATLDDIATEAGVSKGGLVYHFPSKQALLIALGQSITQAFIDLVDSKKDPSDTRPGKLARAYIRASFKDLDAGSLRDNLALAAHLISDPTLQPLADEDGKRWRNDLLQDGLPEATITLIIAACDGVSTGPLWGSALDTPQLQALEQHLLDLTQP